MRRRKRSQTSVGDMAVQLYWVEATEQTHQLWPAGETSVDKQKKTAAELEEIVKQRIGAGDFKVTVHSNPETGWHATIYGRQPSEVHRCQVMAENIVTELSQYYDLAECL